MNLRELRERFVKMVGNNKLVSTHVVGGRTVPDYSVDNGADYYINEGIRILDETLPYPAATRLEDFTLEAGEYELLVPNLRSIERAVLTVDADTEDNNDLRIRTTKEMYEHFKRPFHLIDDGKPYFITRGPVRDVTTDLYGAEQITNGSFTDGSTGWTVGSSWTVAGGEATIATGADSINRLLIYYMDEVITGRTAKVIFTVTYNSPATETNRLWFSVGSREIEVIQLGSFTSSGSHTVEIEISEFDFILLRAGSDFAGSVQSVSVQNAVTDSYMPVLVLPPAQEDYTVRIWGNFWTAPLDDNTDTNFWAANFPGLVILAAGIWHEVELRNSTGANEWRGQLDRRLAMIDFDEVEETLNTRKLPYP